MMLIVIEQAVLPTTRLMKLQTRGGAEESRRPSFHLSIHQHSSILSIAINSTFDAFFMFVAMRETLSILSL